MNLTHKKSLVLAVAAALGMITPLAQASLITSLVDGSDATARKFAIEEQGEATKDYFGRTAGATPAAASNIMVDQDLTILVPVISGYTVTQANRMTVRLTLTGGAKFANKPYLVCSHTAYDAANNASPLTDTTWFNMANMGVNDSCLLSAVGGQLRDGGNVNCTTAANTVNAASAFLMSPDTGGKGSVTATYIFPEKLITRVGVAGASGAGCILTFGQGDDFTKLQSAGMTVSNSAFVTAFSIGTRQNIGLKSEIIYVDAGVNNTKPFEGTIIKFVTAIAPKFVQGSERVIDVKKASKEFVTDGTIVEIGQFALSAGQLAAEQPRFSRSWESGAVGLTTTKTLVSGVSITLSGPTIAGAKQAWLVANAVGNTCQGGTRYGLAQVAATSGASTLIIGASGIGDPTNAPDYFAAVGLRICLEVKGTDLLSDGQLTASFAGLAKSTSFLLDPGNGGELSKITRNGAVVRVLNVPAKDNADQTFLRFYNSSSLPTTVRATLYGADGKSIGTENATLFDALKANDVEILDAAKLEAKLGKPWSGRAWLLIQADVSAEFFKVQSMIRAPGTPGVLINVSGEAYN